MSKKISLKFIKDYLQDQGKESIVQFNSQDIIVKKYISINEKFIIVQNIINGSFDIVDNALKYNPVFYEILYNYYIVKYYTNINVNDNYSEIYDLLMQTGLIKFIKDNIPQEEIKLLESLIWESINEEFDYIKRKDTFVNILTTFLEEFNNINIEELIQKFNKLENIDLIKHIMNNKVQ